MPSIEVAAFNWQSVFPGSFSSMLQHDHMTPHVALFFTEGHRSWTQPPLPNTWHLHWGPEAFPVHPGVISYLLGRTRRAKKRVGRNGIAIDKQ